MKVLSASALPIQAIVPKRGIHQRSSRSSRRIARDPLTVLPYSIHLTQINDVERQVHRILSNLFFSRDEEESSSSAEEDTVDNSSNHKLKRDSEHNNNSNNNNTKIANNNTPHEVTLRPLKGGLSNALFIAHFSHGDPFVPTQLLIRVYPTLPDDDGSHSHEEQDYSLVDHWTETRLMLQLGRPLAPTVYGCFENGRIEEFYPQHVALTSCREMITYGPSIAQLLAQLHAMSGTLQPSTLPLVDCWKRGRHWLDMSASFLKMQQQQQQQQAHNINNHNNQDLWTFWQTCHDEWMWMEQAFATRVAENKDSPVIQFAADTVLTHGDGQSLNVLVASLPDSEEHREDYGRKGAVDDDDSSTDTKSLQHDVRLIDYEYAGFSPRGMDLANTFCEYCDMNNIRADYAAEYPTADQQIEFLHAYLDTVSSLSSSSSVSAMYNTWKNDAAFVTALAHEIGRYTIVSHLQWAIWSIVRHFESLGADGSTSNSSFDYIAYAQHRMDGYYYHKKIFWEQ